MYIKHEESAVALLVGVYVQAAHDALKGSRSAAAWLHINEIPPSSWRAVAKVSAVPKVTQPRRGRRKVA